ncbi:beta-ketoacyl-ACP synthase III [Paracraurococcus ruber]|uniref:Beta-ketoacyl-[acyl-carrier-protein] synthase III n=1 Tax=Paracraurococcus ruber TaxID=77675 RepID=A0ABS1D7N1_9PROT|nr:beta-ketoacyl-ACP synthase III [Paracraurococcus ruber]MBK1662272.1 3-oxoacyl-ACP synthase [Paracraurococcus ruber]TDG13206.1 ketoacyl-ACP synthase III [Paracraurococcus ruber]
MTIRAIIAGCGGYLPERVVTNDGLAEAFGIETSDAWIRERTGIGQRHIAAPGETASGMGAAAARRALERAGLPGAAVDLVVVATATPDSAFPSTAVRIQAAIGSTSGFAFDVGAACTGFVYALGVADAMIRTGQARCALVIGTEVFSRILDWTDRGTCVLFGDGAGAVVLVAEEGRGDASDRGILSTHLHSDGRFGDILHVDGGAGSTGGIGLLRMAGKEVFRHAVTKLAAVVDEALAANGLAQSDVRWLIPHQANARIIDAMGKKLGLPKERVVVTVDRHANTSAASIPLALAEAAGKGLIERGDLMVLEGIGGGLTWGAALARF